MSNINLNDLQADVQGKLAFAAIYYVDPRPEMAVNEKLREQVRDFQLFLIRDMWTLSQ